MSTLKCDSIVSSDGNTDLLTLSNGAVSGVNLGRRNLIINGAMQVAQRGTSGLGSTTAVSYTLDRWFAYRGSVSQQLDSTTGKYALRWTYSSSNDSTGNFISQNIEDINCMHTRGQNVTLSFQVRVNANTWGATDFGYDIIQDTTANRNPNSISQTISTKVAATTSWQTVTKTVTVGANTTNLCITFGRSGATNVNGDWFEVRDVQLEVGSVATPFEHRSYGEELALCQRYYYRDVSNGEPYAPIGIAHTYTTTHAWVAYRYPVAMRVIPTFTVSGNFQTYQAGGVDTVSSFGLYQSSNTTGRLSIYTEASWTAATSLWARRNNDATAYFDFDAEL